MDSTAITMAEIQKDISFIKEGQLKNKDEHREIIDKIDVNQAEVVRLFDRADSCYARKDEVNIQITNLTANHSKLDKLVTKVIYATVFEVLAVGGAIIMFLVNKLI
jgi:uncharacterized coiled-coil DUF342 family protein